MKKKTKLVSIGVVILAAIVAILFYNKARMQASSRNGIISAFPVSVVKADRQQLSESLSLVGTITANNDVAIVSETSGRVTGVSAKIGDYKPAGSVLIQIDDELKSAAYATAEVNYQRAKRDLERYQSLEEENAVSQWQKEAAWQNFKVAEAQYIVARRQLRDTKITTPISGVVTGRPVDVGTQVQNNNVVANVVDISRLKVKLNVAERDAFKLKVGNPVEVTTDVYPGAKFGGTIQSISAKADESHTYPVEIILVNNNKEHPLKSGVFGRVAFTSIGKRDMLAVPRQALVGSLKNPQVFVVENNVARLRNIVVGEEVGTNVAVLGGLQEGEMVVVNGQNNLKDSVTVDVIK
ncbi:MAG: efflux RND transporter periplasmic adaptor subunit [Bacteroidota bacterium]